MQKRHKKRAFSLIELSIVIVIVSILIAGSLGISKTAINNAKIKTTKERMDVIYKALSNFVLVNRRLPCPALLTTAKGVATYGSEFGSPGGCVGSYVSNVANSTNLVYGTIPTQALGLNPDMAEDGFGTKFSYVVDKRFTNTSASTAASDGFEITKARVAADGAVISPALIDIQGPAGTSIVPDKNALFVLISHGINKFKGFNANGTSQNPAGVTDENGNSCDGAAACSTSSANTYNNVFIAYSADTNFDDMVLFATKTQLVRDAGLEFMMCNASEAAQTSPTITWTTSFYGCKVCSNNTANRQKTCGKYGVWGMLSTTNCTANDSNCT